MYYLFYVSFVIHLSIWNIRDRIGPSETVDKLSKTGFQTFALGYGGRHFQHACKVSENVDTYSSTPY